MRYLLLSICLFLLSGCYRMPEEGEVSVIPMTNNPHITGQSSSGTPGIEY